MTKPDPIDLVRRDYFPAAHSSGGREAPIIAYVVIHDGENPDAVYGAEDMGKWFEQAASKGSAHLGVDDNSTQRYLEDATEAWGAPPLNDAGLHIEQAGKVSWNRAAWLQHLPLVQRCAYQVARWCSVYGIPVRWLDAAELLAAGETPGKPQGITSHNNVTQAWHQSTHTDPGPGYPYDVFMDWVRTYFDQITGGDDWMGLFKNLDDFHTQVRIALGGAKKDGTADLSDDEIRHSLRAVDQAFSTWVGRGNPNDPKQFGSALARLIPDAPRD